MREEAAQRASPSSAIARAVPPLLALAKSEEDDVATDAIDSLRRLANPAAAPALLELFDKFPYRKAAIMRALGTTGATEAGPKLIKELEGDDIGAAAKALGQLKYEPAFAVMLGEGPAQQVQGHRLLAAERAVRDGLPQPPRVAQRPGVLRARRTPSWSKRSRPSSRIRRTTSASARWRAACSGRSPTKACTS